MNHSHAHHRTRAPGSTWRRRAAVPLLLLAGSALAALNDTGIDWCANENTNFLACPVSGYPGQDGDGGRDQAYADDRDGDAGFHFVKLDAAGRELPADARFWSCVRDEVTGLVWEVKTDDGGLRDLDWDYSWYDSRQPPGQQGFENGGFCLTRGRCDSEKYLADVNAQGLCNAHDWRLPTLNELVGLVHFGDLSPTIVTDYFPNTLAEGFWTASPYANDPRSSWYVYFYHGGSAYADQTAAKQLRLVHGEPRATDRVDNQDGTITDHATGLTWAKCPSGSSGTDCSAGVIVAQTWRDALREADTTTLAGYDDWRLPNLKELRSLIDPGRYWPAIDSALFPYTSGSFWSSTPDVNAPSRAWQVNVDTGSDGNRNKGDRSYSRLVRGGQGFDRLPLFVLLSGTGQGRVTSDPPGIDCGSSCQSDYAADTVITLSAQPAPGSAVTRWSLSACAGNPTCSLTLERATTVSVDFGLQSYPIHTSVAPSASSGSVQCTPNPVAYDGATTCIANPASGYQFSHWSGACSGSDLSCTLSQITSAQTLTATFARLSHLLHTEAIPASGGQLQCQPNPVEHGAGSVCTATPASGYALSHWGGACAGTDPTASCTLSAITSPQQVSATFTQQHHSILTQVEPSGAGTVSCQPNPVPHGRDSTCTASANSGYHFSYWEGDCSGTETPCTLSGVSGALNVSAHFFSAGQPDATQTAPDRYIPGGLVTIENTFRDPSATELRELVWLPTVPPDWQIVQVTSDTGSPLLDNGAIVFTGQLTLPLTFRYQVSVPGPAEVSGPQTITARARYRKAGMLNLSTLSVEPQLLLDQHPITEHSADYQYPYWSIDAVEYSRVLGYWRAGAYQVYPGTPDGYAELEPGDSGRTDGPRHSADYHYEDDDDWRIDSFEANRVLAYWRAQAYRFEPESLDGYAPGARQLVAGMGALGGLGVLADSAPTARYSADAEDYRPGATLTLTATLGAAGDAPLLALVWAPELPAGWSVTEVSGDGAPELSRTGAEILFTGQDLNLPLQFHYRVAVPANAQGTQRLGAGFAYQRMELIDPRHVTLEPLVLADTSGSCDNAVVTLTDPITSGQDSWRSEQGIEVAGTVAVGPGAALDLLAPRIEFAPGFRVEEGGRLQATAAAVDCSR